MLTVSRTSPFMLLIDMRSPIPEGLDICALGIRKRAGWNVCVFVTTNKPMNLINNKEIKFWVEVQANVIQVSLSCSFEIRFFSMGEVVYVPQQIPLRLRQCHLQHWVYTIRMRSFMCCLVSVISHRTIRAIKNHSQSVIGEQLRVLCIEPGLNKSYQRADVGGSGSKFIKAELIVVGKLIASVIEDHAAV